jgi:hypothetical protein
MQLFTSITVVGGINLYSTTTYACDRDDLDIVSSLAAHIAVAAAESQTEDQLRLAAVNRTLIGQAQGILMAGSQSTPTGRSTCCVGSPRTATSNCSRSRRPSSAPPSTEAVDQHRTVGVGPG